MKRLVLTCSLQHTNHLNPDSLVVKANRSGTRARVVFDYERNNRPDDEPSDQLLLPYTVDPYCLTAQLQGDNSLVIEAPILHQSPNAKLLQHGSVTETRRYSINMQLPTILLADSLDCVTITNGRRGLHGFCAHCVFIQVPCFAGAYTVIITVSAVLEQRNAVTGSLH